MLFLCLALQRYVRREEKLYRDRVQYTQIDEDPLFIIGPWRSGTTHLHYLMALDTDNFAYSTNYQAFLPTLFLTLNEHSWLYKVVKKIIGVRPRLIDSMKMDVSSPQEEEWMYLPLGGFSYIFERLIFPRTAVSDPAEVIRLSNDDQTKEITRKIFKKLTFAHNKRIVSKSPGHVSRIPVLNELFPTSRFVFIVRNPYRVAASIMHASTVLGRLVSLQRHPGTDIASAGRLLAVYFDMMRQHIKLLDPARYTMVKFEELIEDPRGKMRAIYNALGFEYRERYDESLVAYLASLADYAPNTLDITPEMRAVIWEKCRGVFDEYGYVE